MDANKLQNHMVGFADRKDKLRAFDDGKVDLGVWRAVPGKRTNARRDKEHAARMVRDNKGVVKNDIDIGYAARMARDDKGAVKNDINIRYAARMARDDKGAVKNDINIRYAARMARDNKRIGKNIAYDMEIKIKYDVQNEKRIKNNKARKENIFEKHVKIIEKINVNGIGYEKIIEKHEVMYAAGKVVLCA